MDTAVETDVLHDDFIYKVDSKGRNRRWMAQAIGDKVVISHGLLDGKLNVKSITTKAKNVGRSNATTASQQAIKEVYALYERQLARNGYTRAIGGTVDYILSMSALDYSKVPHRLKGELFHVSRKLDGIRAIWRPDLGKFQSKRGVIYDLPILEAELTNCKHILDGEMYIHGMSLNQIDSAVKSPNADTSKLTFVVFDLVNKNQFSTRALEYITIVKSIKSKLIAAVKHKIAEVKDFRRLHDQYVAEGYEGLMIRTADGHYHQGSRPDCIFKWKDFIDKDYTIIGVKTDREGNGVLECEGFSVRTRGDNASRRYQVEHPEEFIGKVVMVRYFTLTEFNVPQFPVGIIVRDDV